MQDGIQATRKVLPKCYFDVRTLEGVDALKAYRYEHDEKLGRLKDKPLHDWSSNPADAFRYLSIACQEEEPKKEDEQPKNSINVPIMQMLEEHIAKKRASQE